MTVVMTSPSTWGGSIVGTPSGTVYSCGPSQVVDVQTADILTLTLLGFAPGAPPDPSVYNTSQVFNMLAAMNDQFVPLADTVSDTDMALEKTDSGVYMASSANTNQSTVRSGLVVCDNPPIATTDAPGRVTVRWLMPRITDVTASVYMAVSALKADGSLEELSSGTVPMNVLDGSITLSDISWSGDGSQVISLVALLYCSLTVPAAKPSIAVQFTQAIASVGS